MHQHVYNTMLPHVKSHDWLVSDNYIYRHLYLPYKGLWLNGEINAYLRTDHVSQVYILSLYRPSRVEQNPHTFCLLQFNC